MDYNRIVLKNAECYLHDDDIRNNPHNKEMGYTNKVIVLESRNDYIVEHGDTGHYDFFPTFYNMIPNSKAFSTNTFPAPIHNKEVNCMQENLFLSLVLNGYDVIEGLRYANEKGNEIRVSYYTNSSHRILQYLSNNSVIKKIFTRKNNKDVLFNYDLKTISSLIGNMKKETISAIRDKIATEKLSYWFNEKSNSDNGLEKVALFLMHMDYDYEVFFRKLGMYALLNELLNNDNLRTSNKKIVDMMNTVDTTDNKVLYEVNEDYAVDYNKAKKDFHNAYFPQYNHSDSLADFIFNKEKNAYFDTLFSDDFLFKPTVENIIPLGNYKPSPSSELYAEKTILLEEHNSLNFLLLNNSVKNIFELINNSNNCNKEYDCNVFAAVEKLFNEYYADSIKEYANNRSNRFFSLSDYYFEKGTEIVLRYEYYRTFVFLLSLNNYWGNHDAIQRFPSTLNGIIKQLLKNNINNDDKLSFSVVVVIALLKSVSNTNGNSVQELYDYIKNTTSTDEKRYMYNTVDVDSIVNIYSDDVPFEMILKVID